MPTGSRGRPVRVRGDPLQFVRGPAVVLGGLSEHLDGLFRGRKLLPRVAGVGGDHHVDHVRPRRRALGVLEGLGHERPDVFLRDRDAHRLVAEVAGVAAPPVGRSVASVGRLGLGSQRVGLAVGGI
ncbi:hypothetical protein ACFQL4_07955 [Halosimplex aquaticum]